MRTSMHTRTHAHIHTPSLHEPCLSARSVFEACFTYRLLIFCMLLLITFTRCEIGDAGAAQVADALQRNSTLTALDLGRKHDMIYVVVCHHFQCNLINICDTYCFCLSIGFVSFHRKVIFLFIF